MNDMKPAHNGTYLVCVSDKEESEIALQYACQRAKRRQSYVSLLHVMEPTTFQGLQSVTDKMREEKLAEAEDLIKTMSTAVFDATGITPSVILKEGVLGEQILETVRESPEVQMLVLGLRPESERGAKLISWLTGKLGDSLLVPMILVPGNLTRTQIEALA